MIASPWAIPGHYHWRLADVQRLPEPIPATGRLGFWLGPDGLPCLTLWPEWAFAVAWLGKDVENRTWRPPAKYIGRRIGIHAGARKPSSDLLREIGATAGVDLVPGPLVRSAIVCTAVLAGVTS